MKRPKNKKIIIQLSTCCAVAAVTSATHPHDVRHRPCFVPSSVRRIRNDRLLFDGSKMRVVPSKTTDQLLGRAPSLGNKRHRSLIRHMSQEDEDGDYDDDDEEDYYDDIETNLNKISWLPSVTLGKQPFKPLSKKSSESRRESANQDRYEAVSSPSSSAPPGFENIDILPVLPMKMVHGLDGFVTNNDDHDDDTLDAISADDIISMSYTADGGVWDEEDFSGGELGLSSMTSSFGPLFSGTSAFLPHTKGHVFTIAEPRYKKLYDDLLRMGSYYGKKRESAIRRAKETGDTSASLPPDPDEKRRFIVTAASPQEEGVFAEYGLLFQLRDLDEVAAVASYDVSGGDGSISLADLQEIVEAGDDQQIFGEFEDGEDVMDILLQTHYEATHDCIGRVKIHRFVNPECWEDGPDGEEYLMAEASIIDLIGTEELGKERKMASVEKAATELQAGIDGQQQQQQQQTSSSLLSSTAMKMQEQMKRRAGKDISSAVARIKDELRSAVGESFKKQQNIDPDKIKDDLMTALGSNLKGSDDEGNTKSNRSSGPIPLAPKILVERRSDDSLTKEERGLRESFAKLVALQHELKEECRFTRVSIQTFGIGPVGMWLSTAAWSQFVEKRLEATQNEMNKDLQAKLAEFMSRGGGDLSEKFNAYDDNDSGALTIDFEELSPELQHELQLVQARATEELGPLALERAIHMQRIVQARTYDERLNILRQCVDRERQRLEAKKMLQSAFETDSDDDDDGGEETTSTLFSREEARNVFERLMSSTDEKDKGMAFKRFDDDATAFQ